MSKLVSKWNYPTTVRFGQGRISELPDALAATGIKRPLFVTDPGLAKLPVVARTLKLLADAGLAPLAASFYAESKRVSNTRMKEDLGVVLAYPTYREGLSALARA